MPTQSDGDLFRSNIDEVLQPSPPCRPMQLQCERVELLTEFFEAICWASPERALRSHLGGHVAEPHLETYWYLLPARGEVGFDGRLAGRDAQNAKALHRSKVNLRRTAQLRRTIGQDVDRVANNLRRTFSDLVKVCADIASQDGVAFEANCSRRPTCAKGVRLSRHLRSSPDRLSDGTDQRLGYLRRAPEVKNAGRFTRPLEQGPGKSCADA